MAATPIGAAQPADAPTGTNEPSAALAQLLADEQVLRTASAQPVAFRPALFWHDDEPVIWPRTVNLIQGQTGVHKSRVAELFGSALLATLAGRPAPDVTLGLGFRPAEGEHYRLLYIDTERNLSDQFPYALQQLKARAGYDIAQHPPEFYYTSLVRVPRAERFPRLAEYLAHYRRGFDGHLIVILDVLSDCLADFNDVQASSGLLDLLNVAVNEQDATFLAVIHENPGSAKARGHLGTEAANKASTVLQVSINKGQGAIQLLYLKRRYAAPGSTFFATFDEAARGLVRADISQANAGPARQNTGFQKKTSVDKLDAAVVDALNEAEGGRLNYTALIEAVMDKVDLGKRSVSNHISDLTKRGGRLSGKDGATYSLVKNAESKSVIYSLSDGLPAD